MPGINESPNVIAGSLRRTWRNAGVPTDGVNGTYAGICAKGDLLIDTTNATLYQNTNTQASPTWTQLASSGVTLDGAYDYGGAGSGRAVTVDSGAVTLTNNAANNNNVLEIGKSPAGAQSGAGLSVTMGANASGAGISFANTGSGNDLLGSGSTWSVSKAGAGTLATLSVGEVSLTEGAAPAGTVCYICRDNTGDTYVNALTGKVVELRVAGAAVVTVAGAAITLAQAVTLSAGAGLTVTDTGITVTAGGITITAGGLTVNAGGATITGNSTITGDLTVSGSLTWGGALTVAGSLTVDELKLDTDGVAPLAAHTLTELVYNSGATAAYLSIPTGTTLNIQVNATTEYSMTAAALRIHGNNLALDADHNTYLDGGTDDTIKVYVGGAEDFRVTANTLAALSGSDVNINSGATLTIAGSAVASDDVVVAVGTGSIARVSYDTTDANANLLMLQLPAGGGTDVPVLAIGQSIESVDLGATGATFNGVVNPTVGIFASGAVATASALRAYKARGTTAAPTVVTSGDDLFSIDAYGAVANNEYVQAAQILFEMTGTIGSTQGPGVITFRTATDAAPSVLTTAMTISAAQLVTCAAGLTLTTGNVTISGGNLDVSNAASDIVIKAATAAALEISDGTTKFYAFDTRVAVTGVTSHALDISDYTIASGATNVVTGLSLAAHTLNYTGNTQVTTQVDTVVIGARTIAGDTATLTVDEANSLLVVAPLEGANVIITAASALRIINAGGTPANQYGIYIEDLTVGATTDVGIYIAGADSAAIYVAADPIHVADNVKVGFGSGTGVGAFDASIFYDGTNLVISPDDIGTGVVSIAGSLTLEGGLTLKSDSATEIGISVTNAALAVGSAGSLVSPYLSSTGAAFTDAIGGDNNGCIGINYDSDTGPTATLEGRVNGSWYSVAIAGLEIQGRTVGGGRTNNEWWHDNQIIEKGIVDETVCVVCGEKLQVGDLVGIWANYERKASGIRSLHAVYGHMHMDKDAYIQALEARIKTLEVKVLV